MPTLQQTSIKQSRHKNDCNRETLQRDKIVTDNIPTRTLYTHYLQHAKTLSETELCTKTILTLMLVIVFYYTVYFR